MGNGHIDMLANMNTEQPEEMLMKFRENMSGVTEDQKTLAMLSLMWMVERRKEKQREFQRENETEGEGTKTTKQTCEREQGKHGEKLADKKGKTGGGWKGKKTRLWNCRGNMRGRSSRRTEKSATRLRVSKHTFGDRLVCSETTHLGQP